MKLTKPPRHMKTLQPVSLTVLLALTALGAACGGGSAPAAPTPVQPPSPTPRPPVTIALAAPSDHFRFSARLTQLSPGQSFEVAFTPRTIDEVEGEEFAHSIEFWLMQAASSEGADFTTDGFALALIWAARESWEVSSTTPGARYRSTGQRVTIRLGEPHTVRMVRTASDAVQFVLDGQNVLMVQGLASSMNVFVRVVGAEASFTYAID